MLGGEFPENRLDAGEDIDVLAGDAVALEFADERGELLAGALGSVADMLLLGLLALQRSVLRTAGTKAEQEGGEEC